jgi:hypothetical protein
MGEIRYIAFRAGAERQRETEQDEKAREGADARDHQQNIRH